MSKNIEEDCAECGYYTQHKIDVKRRKLICYECGTECDFEILGE